MKGCMGGARGKGRRRIRAGEREVVPDKNLEAHAPSSVIPHLASHEGDAGLHVNCPHQRESDVGRAHAQESGPYMVVLILVF